MGFIPGCSHASPWTRCIHLDVRPGALRPCRFVFYRSPAIGTPSHWIWAWCRPTETRPARGWRLTHRHPLSTGIAHALVLARRLWLGVRCGCASRSWALVPAQLSPYLRSPHSWQIQEWGILDGGIAPREATMPCPGTHARVLCSRCDRCFSVTSGTAQAGHPGGSHPGPSVLWLLRAWVRTPSGGLLRGLLRGSSPRWRSCPGRREALPSGPVAGWPCPGGPALRARSPGAR